MKLRVLFCMKPLRLYTVAIMMLMLFVDTNSYAQTIPDSVADKLKQAMNDSARAIILLETGESIEGTTPEKSMEYYKQALQLGTRIKNNRVILSSYIDVGICYINLNKMDSAISSFENAIPFARLLKDTVREARVL